MGSHNDDDDDDEQSGDEPWVMYKDRPSWNDVIPISQNDGPNPVVRIAYTKEFSDVFDYFRAVVAQGELSERVLTLTEDALNLNAANYTVWQYRRKVLKYLNSGLEKELEFCRDMIQMNPKNYQVWHHRRVIIEWLNDPSDELQLTQFIFNKDAKNYHAWEHRQWVLKKFKIYENELEYVDLLLEADVRNNSAWNQRYFVINHTTGFTEEVISQEVQFSQDAINRVPNNESPWNFMRGVLRHSKRQLCEWNQLEEWCQGLYATGHTSPHILGFLIDILESHMDNSIDKRQDHLSLSLQICDHLATTHDKIRVEYWHYIAKHLKQKFECV